jgi:hypothetical protein
VGHCLVRIASEALEMKARTWRFYGMSKSRLVQVWFGIVGMSAGLAVVFSGIVTSEKAQTANEGISITILHAAPSK